MKPVVLVVEDDTSVRQGIALLLKQAGFVPQPVGTAEEAITAIHSYSLPALVVLDVMLPDQDGYRVCQEIRKTTPYIPVLMLSARDEPFDKVAGLEAGADDYLAKPFHPSELIARVRALLRFAAQHTNGVAPAQSTLVYGPIIMCLEKHRIVVAGQPLDLPPKEWVLLELFLRHPGQLFGRETLLRHVWGYDFLGDTRTVDVHIQRLRARLEVTTQTPLIQTVRGFGYRLEALDVTASLST